MELDNKIVNLAIQIGVWFDEMGVTEWKLGPCASRKWLELLEAENARLKEAIEKHRISMDDGTIPKTTQEQEKIDKQLYAALDAEKGGEKDGLLYRPQS